MTARPALAWIPLLSLAGIWGGALSVLPLLPLAPQITFSLGNHSWSGFSGWGLPVGTAAIGGAVGFAVAVSVVCFRHTVTRLLAGAFLGFGGVILSLVLVVYCLRAFWISAEDLSYLAWGVSYFGPLATVCLVFASGASFKGTGPSPDRGWSWGILVHGMLGAAGGALFWFVVPLQGGWLPALGLLSGALYGAFFFAAGRVAARITRLSMDPSASPRPGVRVSGAIGALLLVSCMGFAALGVSIPQPMRPFLGMHKGRLYHALWEYLAQREDLLRASPPASNLHETTGPWIKRWPELGTLGPIAGASLEEVLAAYVRERGRLDPEWSSSQGLLEGADHLTRHRDEDLVARRRLELALHKALKRLTGDDARQMERMIEAALGVEAQADSRSTLPWNALSGLDAIFDVLQREDRNLEIRLRQATSRLREFPLVLADYRSAIASLPPFLAHAGVAACASSLEYLNSLAGSYPGHEAGFQAALKAAIDEVGSYQKFLEAAPKAELKTVGVGPRAFRSLLLAEGEIRSFSDLAQLASDEVVNGYSGLMSLAFQMLDESLEQSELKKLEVSDALALVRQEVEWAKHRLEKDGTYPVPANLELGVLEAPPQYRSLTEPALYWPLGIIEGPRKGLVLLTVPEKDEQKLDEYALRMLARHEAYPGHHLQHLMAREHAPLARRLFPSAFFIEGWATYAAEEAGDAWEKPGDLIYGMVRILWRIELALHVLEELFVHVCQPSPEEAIKLLAKAHRMSRSDAELHLVGILVSPGRRSSYLLGSRELLGARETLSRAMGDRFSKRWFHESVLKLGPVPPSRIVELLR